MRKTARLITLALAASTPLLNAQIITTGIPLGNAITEARYKSQITAATFNITSRWDSHAASNCYWIDRFRIQSVASLYSRRPHRSGYR